MKNGDETTEYLKYIFSDDEKKELSAEMAEGINSIASAEAELKSVKSDFKSRIDALTAGVQGNAMKISNGYEMRNIDCHVRADYARKVWMIYREDTGEMARERKMTADELQRRIFAEGEEE